MRWSSSSRTDVGTVREHNEDALLERPDRGLWVVADGMGGHTAGDLASTLIVERLAALEPPSLLSAFVDAVEDQLQAVNEELRSMAVDRAKRTIGSTVVALLARGRHAVVLWAGDSRAYRLRDGALQQITEDHALVAELVSRGVLRPEQARHHPHGNLVTRAVGTGTPLALDMEIVTLEPEDVFVLCSDGLDKALADDDIQSALGSARAHTRADALVDEALSRGARDNVTAIVVEMFADDADEP